MLALMGIVGNSELGSPYLVGSLYNVPQANRKRINQRNYRRNMVLFESLKYHSHEKVRWSALNEWGKAWDSSLKLFDNLKTEGEKLAGDLLNQENDLSTELKKRNQEENIIGRVTQVVIDVIWEDILNGMLNLENPKVSIRYQQVDKGIQIITEQNWGGALTTGRADSILFHECIHYKET